jgi:hypothetical protein
LKDDPPLFVAVSSRIEGVNSTTTNRSLVVRVGSLVVRVGSLVVYLDRLSAQDRSGNAIDPAEVVLHIRTILELFEIVGFVTGRGGLSEREGWR